MKDNWDSRYQHKEMVFGTKPSEFLVELRDLIRPGTQVLALGDGEARNAVWMAEQGAAVTSLDWSAIAQEKARAFAISRMVNIHFECVDITQWHWPEAAFDMVTSIFLHLPQSDRLLINQHVLRALKPGGLYIVEVYHPDQLLRNGHGPRDPGMLLTAEQVQAELPQLQTILCRKIQTRIFSIDKPTTFGDAVQYLGLKTMSDHAFA